MAGIALTIALAVAANLLTPYVRRAFSAMVKRLADRRRRRSDLFRVRVELYVSDPVTYLSHLLASAVVALSFLVMFVAAVIGMLAPAAVVPEGQRFLPDFFSDPPLPLDVMQSVAAALALLAAYRSVRAIGDFAVVLVAVDRRKVELEDAEAAQEPEISPEHGDG